LKAVPCLLYCGNSLSDDASEYVLGNNCSADHVALPEPISMTGLEPAAEIAVSLGNMSTQEAKLKESLKRILVDGESYRQAVESVYGDPLLEAALNDLYDAMKAGKPTKDLIDLRDGYFGKEPWEKEFGVSNAGDLH
jgi:hypothetical protein